MPGRVRARSAPAAGLLAVVLTAACVPGRPAGAADLCDALDVPAGSGLACREEAGGPDGPRAVVRPEGGPFAGASELEVWRVAEPVADPDAWLRRQVTFDLSGLAGVVRGLVASPDSPFTAPEFRDGAASFARSIESLGRLPLEGCAPPRVTGGARELRCVWRAGPVEQGYVVRLIDAADGAYATAVRAVNPKRLAELEAIAASFAPARRT